jgi:hypothetical protein
VNRLLEPTAFRLFGPGAGLSAWLPRIPSSRLSAQQSREGVFLPSALTLARYHTTQLTKEHKLTKRTSGQLKFLLRIARIPLQNDPLAVTPNG